MNVRFNMNDAAITTSFKDALTDAPRQLQINVKFSRELNFVYPAVAAVLLWLAQGAVQRGGGIILDRILGNPDLNDVQNFIRACVDELKGFVREELKKQLIQNEMVKLQSAFESAIRNLKDYGKLPANAREDNRFLVQDALVRSGEVMSLAAHFGMIGVFVYASAVSARSMAYLTLDQVPLAKDTLREGIRHVKDVLFLHELIWRPTNRIHDADYIVVDGPNDNHEITVLFVFTKDGKEIKSPAVVIPQDADYMAQAIAKMPFWEKLLDEAEREYEDVMKETLIPLTAVMQEWTKAIEQP
jgi:hypothetical protein